MKLSQFQWGGWTCVRSAASVSLWPEGLGTADSSVRGLNLVPEIQWSQSDREKQILSVSTVSGIQKNGTGEPTRRAGTETQPGAQAGGHCEGRRGGRRAGALQAHSPTGFRLGACAHAASAFCLTLAVRVLPHFYLSFKTQLWFQVPLEAKSELSHKGWIGLYGIPKALCITAILALTRHMRTVTQLSPNWTVNS